MAVLIAIAPMFDGPPLEEYVPAWVLWGQVAIVPLAAFLVVYLPCRWSAAVASGPRPLPGTDQWWLRAERFAQVRAARFTVVVVMAAIVALLTSLVASPLSNVTAGLRVSLAAVATVAAVYAARAATARQMLCRSFSTWRLARDHVVTLAVFGFSFYLFALVAAFAMPARYDATTAAWLVGVFALGVAMRYGGSIWLLGAIQALVPAPRRVCDAVAAVGGGNASVYELRVGYANAVAFPTHNAVAFTTRFLEICNEEELKAVAAHEVAHLGDPNMQRSTRLSWVGLAFIVLLVQLRPVAATWGSTGKNTVFAAAAAFAVYTRFKGRGVRAKGEAHADSEAAKLTDPTAYARALENLYRDRLGTVRDKSWLGHASLYDRMTSAGVTPEFERVPKQLPAIFRPRVLFAAVLPAMTCGLLAVVAVTAGRVAQLGIDEPRARLAYNTLFGGTALEALDAAEVAAARGDAGLVRAVIRRVVERSPDDIFVWAKAAGVLALTGFDDDADAAVTRARKLVADEAEQERLDLGKDLGYATAAAEYVDDVERYIQSVRASRRRATTP